MQHIWTVMKANFNIFLLEMISVFSNAINRSSSKANYLCFYPPDRVDERIKRMRRFKIGLWTYF